MEERSLLITGCSSGIGRASARVMKARGWRVFATARRAPDLAALREEGFEAVPLELADGASIAACAESVLAATEGRLFGLFNNAAYAIPSAVEDLTGDALRRQFEVNLFGWHELTRRVLPAMREAGRGRIVQNSSVLGFVSAPWRGSYCASKFALEALSDAMRLELEGSGIALSIIEPGPIESRFLQNALAAYRREIDAEGSVHREQYRRRMAMLEAGGDQRFKLPPEAVAAKLVHALESPRPRSRYRVTTPTQVMAMLVRLLPRAGLDAVVRRSMG